MLIDMRPDEALDMIENAASVFEHKVVPRNGPRAGHSPYLPEYDWMFLFERKLMKFLDRRIEEHRRELVGPSGLLSEALSNSYCHGNRRDPDLPIYINVFKGDKGLLIKIEDSGDGFNYEETLSKLERGGNYYKLSGNGTKRMMASENFAVFYGESGRTFYLLYLFGGLGPLSGRSLTSPSPDFSK